MAELEPIDFSAYRQIVVLTGAGISVASGLRPYRGPGGLWEEVEASRFADRDGLERDPAGVWRFFAEARAQVRTAEPNAAHRALATLEQRLPAATSFVLLTQNIDGLHQAAGSREVVELHGNLERSRCAGANCDFSRSERERERELACPACPSCGAPLRPDVVLFGESLGVDVEWRAKKALRDCDLFLAVGTSGTVTPAASFVRSAEYAGARTILVNLDAMEPRNPAFGEEILGKAEEVLPRLVG